MIRGKISFGDGGRGLATVGLNKKISIGKPVAREKDCEWYCIRTGKKMRVISFVDWLKEKE